jgi:hypothetical protein
MSHYILESLGAANQSNNGLKLIITPPACFVFVVCAGRREATMTRVRVRASRAPSSTDQS